MDISYACPLCEAEMNSKRRATNHVRMTHKRKLCETILSLMYLMISTQNQLESGFTASKLGKIKWKYQRDNCFIDIHYTCPLCEVEMNSKRGTTKHICMMHKRESCETAPAIPEGFNKKLVEIQLHCC